MALNLKKNADAQKHEHKKNVQKPVLDVKHVEKVDVPQDQWSPHPVQPAKKPELDQFQMAKQRLHSDFVQDMTDASISTSMSEEQQANAKKRYKSLKKKKMAVVVAIVVAFVGVTIFGVYNTFLKHELTFEEIAYIANAYNGQTNFPLEGVQGYLDANVEAVMLQNLTVTGNHGGVAVKDPHVEKVSLKNDYYANVYFNVMLEVNDGEQRLECMVPLQWDPQKYEYHLAGSVILTPAKSPVVSTELVENPFLSFANCTPMDETSTANCKTFVNNFMEMLYSDKDVTPYYSGEQLHVDGLKYDGMDEFFIYVNTNANGYNAYAKVNLKTDVGIMYSTVKYMTVVQNGSSWNVLSVM